MDSSSKSVLNTKEHQVEAPSGHKENAKPKYRFIFIIMMILLHLLALHTIVFKLHLMKIWTLLYTVLLVHLATFGSTAGAHRLWSHRAYKAKLPLRILLLLCVGLAGQVSIYVWARTHRVHHRFVDTDLDPHNSKRGFWYSHMGWYLMKNTPEVQQKLKEIDMSDIIEDPVASFHSRWFYPISFTLFFLPPLIPVYVWEEDFYLSILAAGFLKYVWVLHNMGSINSIAHMFGSRPYDKRIRPAESVFVALFAMGEGWHNYHHTFPWDYKATEVGGRLDYTARLLELFAKIGWAYDLKTASPTLIATMKDKYGDHSAHNGNSKGPWHQE